MPTLGERTSLVLGIVETAVVNIHGAMFDGMSSYHPPHRAGYRLVSHLNQSAGAMEAIFVGGSGREINRLVDLAADRLRVGGRLVASVGSIESVSEVYAVMRRRCADVKVWMLNIARGTEQFERLRFEALNPTFLLAAVKPK